MIRIFPEQLSQQLAQRLAPVYLLVGSDPLLLGECEAQISEQATIADFSEKERLTIDSNTDWDALEQSLQEVGLFSNKQILLLECPENLNATQQKKLQQLISLLHAERLLILVLPKLNKTTEQQGWFTTLNERFPNSLLINCQTPTPENLPKWLAGRIKTMGLQADNEAIQLLCYSYENNLLALKQALQLLDLLYGDKKLNYARVQAVVEQSSVFTPFQWVDALLAGKAGRAKRILQGLQAEDVQPIILLRTIQRELLVLLELSRPQQPYHLQDKLPQQTLKAAFDRLKIWQNRRALFTQAVQRLTYHKLYLFCQQLAEIERSAKQQFNGDIWQQLEAFSVEFCA